MAGRNYQDLVAWQRAMDLATAVYRATQEFPREEQYGLTIQLRRAVVSVPSNIAEGQGRKSRAEFQRSLAIAYGSLREVETQVILAGRLNLLTEPRATRLLDAAGEVGRLINGLSASLTRM